MMQIPPSEEVVRQQLMPILDRVARECKERGMPLLTVMSTNYEDGRTDYEAVQRHWMIRYGTDLKIITLGDKSALDRIIGEERAACSLWVAMNDMPRGWL